MLEAKKDQLNKKKVKAAVVSVTVNSKINSKEWMTSCIQ